jgi:hypothetical protein
MLGKEVIHRDCGAVKHRPVFINLHPNAFERSLRILAPGGRDGGINRKLALQLFSGRASWDMIKNWRYGKGGVPAWAVEALRERARCLDELMPGPGQGASWRRWRESQPAVYREKQGKRSVVYRDKPKP